MQILPFLIIALSMWMTVEARAECTVTTGTPTYTEGKRVDNPCDANGRLKTVTDLASTSAGEDVPNDVQKVETRWTNLPNGATTAMFASDTAILNAKGFVHAITCYSDATATAGTIALLDNTAAGAGNVLWSFDVLAVAYTTPFTVILDVPFAVGLYADFTTTGDMKCMVQYRVG